MTVLTVPTPALIALVGAAGSGKTTFAAGHFAADEVYGPEALQSGDPDQDSPTLALRQRLEQGQLTVLDAPHLHAADRKRVVTLARACGVAPVALVLDLPPEVLLARQGASPRPVRSAQVWHQVRELRHGLEHLAQEGFEVVHVLSSRAQANAAQVKRVPPPSVRRGAHGPFDIIGDVHGCRDELVELLTQLGYTVNDMQVTPPQGRTTVFLGDLVDRGPDTPGVLRLVMGMVEAGTALCVAGNHDDKLRRALAGRAVSRTHGLEVSLAQLDREPGPFRTQVRTFLGALPSHYVLDGGRLVVAHAGLPERFQGRDGPRVRAFALYGDTDGTLDAAGQPVRRNWAAQYRGSALVVYGHTPVRHPLWQHHTVNLDTGCVFGGQLSALRYPELQTVSVPARAVYRTPSRPLLDLNG
ncbi:metallophosphoesterase [Deinococcus sonorensis]|uniref:AAA family ATPase n=2 Tax=Deinococcus sonorensis TaxID=309891 RepID=A0AAU7UAI5_9DEIO